MIKTAAATLFSRECHHHPQSTDRNAALQRFYNTPVNQMGTMKVIDAFQYPVFFGCEQTSRRMMKLIS